MVTTWRSHQSVMNLHAQRHYNIDLIVFAKPLTILLRPDPLSKKIRGASFEVK